MATIRTTSNGASAHRVSAQPSPAPTIEVRNLKLLTNATALKATCTVKYGDTTVEECKIFWPDGKEPFVNPPQLVNEYEGRRTWVTIIRWSRPLHDQITAAVLAAYYQATGQRPYAPLGDEEAF